MTSLAWVLIIIFAAFFVRGTFGFGDALVGMPLLVLVVGTDIASPLVALLSLVLSAVILIQDWRDVRFRGAIRLILPALIGIVIGLWVLRDVREAYVVGLLGVVLIGFGLYSVLRPDVLKLTTDRTAPLFGVVAGILSGAYNAPGPVLVIYGSMRRWPPAEFRATLQAFFLPTSAAVVVGHAIEGRLTGEVMSYFGWSVPVVAICLLAGRWLNARIPSKRFIPLLNALFVALGGLLLRKALFA